MLTLQLDTCALRMAQVRSEKDHHLSVSGEVDEGSSDVGVHSFDSAQVDRVLVLTESSVEMETLHGTEHLL